MATKEPQSLGQILKEAAAAEDRVFNAKAMRAVRAVVMGELEDAYDLFHAQPGAGHFGRLEDAMYAAQLIAQEAGQRFVLETLVHVPVAQWLDAIQKHLVDSGRRH